MLGYKPAPETTIILVNEISQLEQMYESLLYAGVVGMSLVRPLAKPWAREKRAQPPAQLQVHTVFKQGQEQKQTKEQQHPSLKQQKKYKDGGGVNTGGVNTDGETGAGGVFLQLACQNDNHVYVIDLEVFLDRSVDPLNKLPRLLGELFFNLSICKLAYNWNEESKLLKEMFPTLRESRYHMDNLLDFYFIWIAHDLSSTTLVAQLQSDHPQPQLQNPITTTTKTNKIVAGRVPDIYKIKAWCTEKPLLPTTMSQPRFENVSGLLYRVMGKFLRRTSSLGWNAWTIRPLPVSMSAQCLVDMFAVLDKPGARRDREETAEFKLQHKFKM
ncbi:hypothetical protein BGW39_009659 [Mortierella sp. 14UC]|nr:hypothetical protein BGW39_009659 [Mortierella sp. 14UC]